MRLLIFLSCLALGIFSFADSGGVGSGGGGICQTPSINKGHPIFLDLALSAEPILDLPTSQYNIPNTKVLKNVGLDEFPLSTAVKLAKGIDHLANEWKRQLTKDHDEKSQVILLSQILAFAKDIASQSVPYFMVTNQNLPIRHAEIPDSSVCDRTAVTGVAIYNRELVVISQPVWNSLGAKSKLAVLIHEILRKLQITHELRSSTQELQDLTRIIVMGPKKSKGVKIYEHPFFKGWDEQMADLYSQKSSEIYDDFAISYEKIQKFRLLFVELQQYYGDQPIDFRFQGRIMEIGPETAEAVRQLLPKMLNTE